jgi:hypothetical protein
MTSSARASKSGGMVRPSNLAVSALRFARLHDRQVSGLRALEDAPDIDADLTIRIKRELANTPELKDERNATVLYVFPL